MAHRESQMQLPAWAGHAGQVTGPPPRHWAEMVLATQPTWHPQEEQGRHRELPTEARAKACTVVRVKPACADTAPLPEQTEGSAAVPSPPKLTLHLFLPG